MSRVRYLTVGITAAMLLGLGATPAGADTKVVRDKVGETNAANDITRVRFSNGEHRISAVFHYRNLGEGHFGAEVVVDVGHKGARAYALSRVEVANGKWRVRLFRFSQKRHSPYQRVRCHGKSVEAFPGPKSKLLYRLPQRCLGDDAGDAWFQVRNYRSEGAVEGDHAPRRPVFVAQD